MSVQDDSINKAGVAKLGDALDLGSSAERRGGSSPSIRTTLGIEELQVARAIRLRLDNRHAELVSASQQVLTRS